MAKILAIDYGEKRIGVAISDDSGRFAFARDALLNADERALLKAIANLVRDEAVERVLVGLPLSLDGSASTQTKSVIHIVKLLSALLEVPVDTYDERLTTKAAKRKLGDKRDGTLDSEVAKMILEEYLEKNRA